MPLAETALASQPNRQHDKIAAKPRAPSQIEGFVEQHTYKCFFKASNAPVDPRQVEKVTVTVKLHADDSAADGKRAVTSKVNRPAISPVVNVGVAAARRPPAGKVGSPKTGKKLFLAKGLVGIIVRAAQLVDYADRYAFIASVALFMIFGRKKTKDKRKKRSHKCRGLARCRRRKIDAMIAVELGVHG